MQLLKTVYIRRNILAVTALLCFAVTANAKPGTDLNKTVRFSGTHITIGKAMKEIEAQSGYTFAFNMTQLNTSDPVRFAHNEMTVGQALEQMFGDGRFNYVIRTRFIAVGPNQKVSERANAVARERDNSPVVIRDTTNKNIAPVISKEPEYEIKRVVTYIQPEPVERNYPVAYSAYEAAGRYAGMQTSLPRIAAKTNLLYGGVALAPNLALEVGTAQRQTLEFSGSYSWWGRDKAKSDSHKQSAHWMLRPEYRWWTCERFNGHYFGAHALYSRYYISGYDVPTLFDKEYSYDGHALGAGVTYGYHWAVGKRIGLEFNIGAGYAYLWYDKGNCVKCDPLNDKVTKHYAGLTRAGINLVFMID